MLLEQNGKVLLEYNNMIELQSKEVELYFPLKQNMARLFLNLKYSDGDLTQHQISQIQDTFQTVYARVYGFINNLNIIKSNFEKINPEFYFLGKRQLVLTCPKGYFAMQFQNNGYCIECINCSVCRSLGTQDAQRQ
ncbi:hypothetical protein ABPG72_008880 [Tetrahymena utriculariae]